MEIKKDDIKRAVTLSRIRVEDSELDQVGNELASIMQWIEQLEQMNIEGAKVYAEHIDHTMVERDDVCTEGGVPEAILQNAPEKAHNMFAVPKVVE